MSESERDQPREAEAWPDDLVLAEEAGVRVFYIAAAGMQELVDRLALVLGEHMHDDDELHVTYNAMQSGWQDHPPTKGGLARRAEPGWTELRLRALRVRGAARARRAAAALTAGAVGTVPARRLSRGAHYRPP